MSDSVYHQVWAPRAENVRLNLDGERFDMRSSSRGWWVSDQIKVAGTRYGFELFDGKSWSNPLPDPRSLFQPDGVHGLSEVIDPSFAWTDISWTGRILAGGVIYELHVGTFTPEGTFEAIIDKFEHLKAVGVTAIELMPVQPFGGQRNWGYDSVFWHAVHSGYGGPTGLKKMVNAAHDAGIAVYLDVVYNHFGPEGNYNGKFGPYTSSGSTGWGETVNLNDQGSDEVRSYILDAVTQWLIDFHIDGLRLDAVHSFESSGAVTILEQLSIEAQRVSAITGIPRSLIAESDLDDPLLLTPRAAQGYGITAQWVDDIHHAVHTLVSGERAGYYAEFGSTKALAKTLTQAFYFTGQYSEFRGRRHGRSIRRDTAVASDFIAYTTTHDQTGNRAKGDRPSMNLSPEQQLLKASVIYCSAFTPMLFMGEEYGATTPFAFFCSHTDPELNRLTAAGRKAEFAALGWDPEEIPDPAAMKTFTDSRLNWDFTEVQKNILDAYSTLLKLRKTHGLAQPNLENIEVDFSEQWLALGNGDIRLIANFSDSEVEVPYGGELLYSFTEQKIGSQSSILAPWCFAILSRT